MKTKFVSLTRLLLWQPSHLEVGDLIPYVKMWFGVALMHRAHGHWRAIGRVYFFKHSKVREGSKYIRLPHALFVPQFLSQFPLTVHGPSYMSAGRLLWYSATRQGMLQL
ncbi:hypothetical protein EDB86DRAFT_2926700 [Lactarius hatsudake]|nr:hypothetical protein EDB86DRAFT_2926700 [Lactarius hatsudake]